MSLPSIEHRLPNQIFAIHHTESQHCSSQAGLDTEPERPSGAPDTQQQRNEPQLKLAGGTDISHLRNVSSLKFIQTLGTGTFARVHLVKPKSKAGPKEGKSQLYALKVLRKAQVIKTKQIEHARNEREILERCREHPFITRYITSWSDWSNLYILMEYCPGGEIFTYLREYERFPQGVAQFYAAEMVAILAFLHQHGIVYRDLKPENILLDAQGHIRLADFGFAKFVGDRETYTICGTPEYLAPEVISTKGHGKAVDWWALGVFIYEMCCGFPPFYDSTSMKIYEKIVKAPIKFPKGLPDTTRDIISRLCVKDRTARLGNLAGGSLDVATHPYFEGINWEKLIAKDSPGPIIPALKSAEDTRNFEKYPDEPIPNPDDYSLSMFDRYEQYFQDF